jgi:predicted HTH domain antitoxin
MSAFIIPDSVLDAARMSAAELLQEVAALLYAKDRLTLGQASRLAEMDQLAFQHLLASRGIDVHYDVEDLQQDVETLRRLGRL